MSNDERLGVQREVQLADGVLRYRERGEGPVVVFVHGLLVNGDLWRAVVPPLVEAGYRCITPDWPLGSHESPMPDAALTPPAVAELMAQFLTALDLEDVTIVANDTGGGLTQLLMVEHPQRIGAVVLTPCDAFDNFPPKLFRPLQWFARSRALTWMLMRVAQWRWTHRLPVTFGLIAKRPIPLAARLSYLRPGLRDAAIRRDLRRFLIGLDSRYTEAAAHRLPEFSKPVQLIWASEDKLFPLEHANALARLLPDARVRLIEDSYTFVSEDQPQALAEAVMDFLRERERLH